MLTILRSVLLCLAFGLGLTLTISLHSQIVPALVNYQGRLANPDGTALATGDYTLTFRVYDSATNSGGLIWGPQVFDGVAGQGHGGEIPVVQGYFNVMLGPVDTNGVSLASAFNATNRFVEITVSNHSAVLPRQQILTAPFAFNSARLAGADWSAVFGTNDPVNGKIPTTKLATNGVILAQQVGIGLASPTAPLHVKSTGGGFGAIFEATNGINNVTLLSHNGGGNYGSSLDFTDNSTISATIRSVANGGLRLATAGTEWLALDGSGNLGIGTVGPYFPLHLIKAGTASGYLAGFLQPSLANGNSVTMWFGRADAQYQSGSFSYLYNASTPSSSRFSMGLFGNSAVLNVLGNGNVGIGTSSPQSKLDVSGNLRVSSDANSAVFPTNAAFRISRADDSNKYVYMGYDSDNFAFIQPIHQTVEYRPLVLNPSGGNVGIGLTNPTNKLHVAGGVSATAFVNTSDRNAKQNFVPVSAREVLAKVVVLPISTWNFKDLNDGRHMGPMAQDFYAAFGLGGSETTITTIDPDGVSLAAIQGLNQKLEEKLKEKGAEIELLKERLNRLEGKLIENAGRK